MVAGPAPSSADAARIARQVAGVGVRHCVRFPTGLRHWVYDVELDDGKTMVVRLSEAANRAELAGGVFWNDQLGSVDVPVPELIAFDLEAPQPYMVLERLPGTDLGNVWHELSDLQLDRIASTVAELQRRTSRLPSATGFGYALDHSTRLAGTWCDVLHASIARSEQRIAAAGVVDPAWVDRVRTLLDRSAGLLTDVEPVAFLHDATTKNVIVNDGDVVGIVDTDELCFGDPLWAAALTRMSLLAAGRPTSYADRLAAELGIDRPARMPLYTSIFAIDFLSELGQRFNRDQATAVSDELVARLTSVLAQALDDATGHQD